MSRLRRLTARWIVAAAAATAGVSCSNSPTAPPETIIIEGPKISCPAGQLIDSTASQTQVTYAAPAVTGGTTPLTTTCVPASGSAFPAGRTDVVCTTTDAVNRKAACTFPITITKIPLLKGTKFLAFGDSITAGENGLSFSSVIVSQSYPTLLQQLMVERYTAQTPTVANYGCSGEDANSFGLLPGECVEPLMATQRLREALATVHPDALLLLEGANDLNEAGDSGPATILRVRDALRVDIQSAKAAGVQAIFLSTLTPEVPGKQRAFHPELVEPMNTAIRNLAVSEGVFLVDTWAAFKGNEGSLIGNDGLHTTPAGNLVIAQTFLAAISANFEVLNTATSARRIR